MTPKTRAGKRHSDTLVNDDTLETIEDEIYDEDFEDADIVEEDDEDIEDEGESHDEDDATLFAMPPNKAPAKPLIVADIVDEASYNRADPELQAQFHLHRRLCACCKRAAALGAVCGYCADDHCHWLNQLTGERYGNATRLSNGYVKDLCIMVPSESEGRSLETSKIARRRRRTYQIYFWKLAVIEAYVSERECKYSDYYTGVKPDFRQLALVADPDVVPYPEFAEGATVGLRKILRAERIAKPVRPLLDRGAYVQAPAPPWYGTSNSFVTQYDFHTQTLYVEYEPIERTQPAVLERYTSRRDGSDADQACAMVGDRYCSTFGPRVTSVKRLTRMPKRPDSPPDALSTYVPLNGKGALEILTEVDPLESFDQTALKAAIVEQLTHHDEEPLPEVTRKLLDYLTPMGIVHLARGIAMVTDDEDMAEFDPDNDHGEIGRYSRGFCAADDAIAGIMRSLIQCPDCFVYETGHRGPIPCGNYHVSKAESLTEQRKERAEATISAQEQLALF